MEWIERSIQWLKTTLSISIFRIGEFDLTLWSLFYIVFLIWLLMALSGKLKRWIAEGILGTSAMEVGRREAIGSITRYVVVTVGFLVIIQTAGIDLTTLNVLAGAVGIGVGFGLQNIANNFISGIIILLERPIKIGDRIEIGEIHGDVMRIGARSTTVVTNDNITVVIPNSKLVTENVVNWSHNDDSVRLKIPVHVAYGSDVRLVERLLLEVASDNPDVLKGPAPTLRFAAFGESGLHFELRVWTGTLTHRKGVLISAMNFAIYEKLRSNGIEIPFPQRDIHIRTGST